MFAILVQEREPLGIADLPAGIHVWLLVAGVISVLVLAIRLILWAANKPQAQRRDDLLSLPVFLSVVLIGGALLALLPTGMHRLWKPRGWLDPLERVANTTALYHPLAKDQIDNLSPLFDALMFVAGAAIVAAFLPIVFNLRLLRFRRIWALAKLSLKEAVRRRVLWVFSLFLLVVLFASWFMGSKPENQVRDYVVVVSTAMQILLLVVAGLLAAFSIPADLKSQTMHTIVTKPVERFEIILGRFLGYLMLMTLVLVAVNLMSLIYVYREINQEAKEESLKARDPIYGSLIVTNGQSVGYEWDYRQYITMKSPAVPKEQDATWTFTSLPAKLAKRTSPVPCEFSFDIFRTTKGEENKGVPCTFVFKNPKWDDSQYNEFTRERQKVLSEPDPEILERARREQWSSDKTLAVRSEPLAEKFGYFEAPAKEVVDFHTLSVEIPAAIFKPVGDASKAAGRPPLQIVVKCDSPTQYLGVAKYDLYLLDSEAEAGADVIGFALNFFKGGGGLWLRMAMVIGLALTFSTYLSGVISFLATMWVYLLGMALPFIKTIAEGTSETGGGPLQAGIRVFKGLPTATPLEQTPGVTLAQNTDTAIQTILGFVLRLIPDVDRFDFTAHVAEGFNVPAGQFAVTTLFLLAYLVPVLALAYYLIRAREVAA